MALKESIRRPNGKLAAEAERLARLEERYRRELMSEEQRLELRDQIGRMQRNLETAAETVDAIHSGLERMRS